MSRQTISARTEAAKGTLEEGTAFAKLAGRDAGNAGAVGSPRTALLATESFPVVVIGAGQSGLSVGFHLARRKIPFVILESDEHIGDVWRRRWDSLRLFTPARHDGLDGMNFPASPRTFPTKDEMGDFLEAYAAHFNLPVRCGVKVDGLSQVGDQFLISAGNRRFKAAEVVVAMSDFQRAKVPPFATNLRRDVVQLHSIEYRGPTQLKEGGVLIVGAGNSGSEIARELASAGRQVFMSGRDTGHVPFRIESWIAQHLLLWLVLRVLFYRVLTTDTPIGRKARPGVLSQGGPLIRVKPKDLAVLGVKRVPRTTGTQDGLPLLADGRALDVANVIWCTGFHPGFDWLQLPVLDDHGHPRHERGVARDQPGLYFTGLEFLYSLSSTMVQGAGRDAHYIVDRIAERMDAVAVRGVAPNRGL